MGVLRPDQIRNFVAFETTCYENTSGIEQALITDRAAYNHKFQRQIPRGRVARAGEQHMVALMHAKRSCNADAHPRPMTNRRGRGRHNDLIVLMRHHAWHHAGKMPRNSLSGIG